MRTEIAFIVVIIFSLVGCGAGANGATPPATVTRSIPPILRVGTPTRIVFQAATPTPNDGITRITVGDDYFEPAVAIIKAGTTVEWWHGGGKEHTIASLKNDFPTIMPGYGGRYRMSFDIPGEFPYTCSLHSGMNGMIKVVH